MKRFVYLAFSPKLEPQRMLSTSLSGLGRSICRENLFDLIKRSDSSWNSVNKQVAPLLGINLLNMKKAFWSYLFQLLDQPTPQP